MIIEEAIEGRGVRISQCFVKGFVRAQEIRAEIGRASCRERVYDDV